MMTQHAKGGAWGLKTAPTTAPAAHHALPSHRFLSFGTSYRPGLSPAGASPFVAWR